MTPIVARQMTKTVANFNILDFDFEWKVE